MVCVGLSERGLKNFGRATGGARQNFGGQWPPWHPPSSAPVCRTLGCYKGGSCERFAIDVIQKFVLHAEPDLIDARP